MQLTITSPIFSLNGAKRIFVNDTESYIAKSQELSSNNYKLFHLQTGFAKAIISREVSFFTDSFNVRLFNEDNLLLKFKRISMKHEYMGNYFEDTYEILEYSVLKNGIEIGYLKDEEETILDREYNFEVISADEKEFELIISFFVFIVIRERDKDN